MQLIRSLIYKENADQSNRFAKLELDSDLEEDYEITLNGTDNNGDAVFHNFIAIDNYFNQDEVDITIDDITASIPSFTKVIWQVNPLTQTLTVSVTDGTVTVWISEKKLPIGEGTNQHGEASLVANTVLRTNTRASIAAIANAKKDMVIFLSEKGREGLFVFTDTPLNALVTADIYQAIYIAPSTDVSGGSGAWVRQWSWYTGLNVTWFGAVLDDITDDHLFVLAARDMSNALARDPSGANPYYKSGPPVFVPGTAYMGSSAYDMHHQHELIGINPSSANGTNYPSHLRADNSDVVIVQNYNTEGTNIIDVPPGLQKAAAGSVIRRIQLIGNVTNTEGEFHGARVKARCGFDNVRFKNMRGDGIFAHTDTGGVGESLGNSNHSWVKECVADNCRDGLNLLGGDANTWLVEHFETSSCRRWGRSVNAFLDATFLMCESADSGLVPGFLPSVVSNGGNRYAVVYNQEANASVTAPVGTVDTAYWLYMGPGGVNAPLNIVAWVNAMALRAGGAACFQNVGDRFVDIAPYAEGGQGPIQAIPPGMIIQPQADVRGNAATVRGTTNGTFAARRMGALDRLTDLGITLGDGISFPLLEILDSLDDVTLWKYGADFHLGVFNSTAMFFKLLGDGTANPIGRRLLEFPNGFGVSGLKILYAAAAPVAGTYVRGDRVINTLPVIGSPKSWVCTVGGTPGTWVSEGNL